MLPALIVSLASLCLAQAPPAVPAPVITFANTHHAFGRVYPDHRLSVRYKVTNTGTAPLQISKVNQSCGCTTNVIGQWYLKPGESSEVEASFDPRGLRGLLRKSLEVISNDPVHPSTTLTFEADVIQEVNPNPAAVFFFDVPRNESRKLSVRLDPGTDQSVSVKEIRIPGAPHLTESHRVEGKSVVVDFILDGRKVARDRQDGIEKVTIVTGSERTPLLPIDVQWNLKQSILVQPIRVAWLENAGKPLTARVVLTHVDATKGFRVLAAKPSHSAIKVEGLNQSAASRQELRVIFGASVRPGRYTENILLTTDDPEQPEVEVKVSAVLR